jgi:hypothetical protein
MGVTRDGKVIKANDLMDATRYLVVSGLSRMKTKPGDVNRKPSVRVRNPSG